MPAITHYTDRDVRAYGFEAPARLWQAALNFLQLTLNPLVRAGDAAARGVDRCWRRERRRRMVGASNHPPPTLATPATVNASGCGVARADERVQRQLQKVQRGLPESRRGLEAVGAHVAVCVMRDCRHQFSLRGSVKGRANRGPETAGLLSVETQDGRSLARPRRVRHLKARAPDA